MEKTVKVSVIMLAYNIENYIEIAIKGVLSQKTDYPVELIIGEDRSTDRTYEICKGYGAKPAWTGDWTSHLPPESSFWTTSKTDVRMYTTDYGRHMPIYA